jgi:hypothetical protein
MLWPPNHKMVDVALDVVAVGDPSPTCLISSITSNESSISPGQKDWVVTGPLAVDLRAERAGSNGGRMYTITVTCTNSINSAHGAVTVRVPHDQGN